MDYVKVSSVADLWNGEMKGVVVDGNKILLVKMNDQIYAYEDRCAHLGLRLSHGTLVGRKLTCGAHLWEYDVCSGQGINPATARLCSVPVRVDDGQIFVAVPSRKGASS